MRATLHTWASLQPGARAMRGRGTTWATALPSGQPVAVRHSLHGGILAAITRDLFLAPTRAPHELATALRLARSGVRTPGVLGFAVYAATGPLCRADVVTELLDGVDLVSALRVGRGPSERDALFAAVRQLLDGLSAAGALHPDLNARNIFILHDPVPCTAAVLDVDRVRFVTGPDVATPNASRLARSLRKVAAAGECPVTDGDITGLTAAAHRGGAARSA